MAEKTINKEIECNDKCCPIHGHIKLRGRSFKGTVIKKFPKRVVIEFDRTLFVEKYERYSKRKTKLHARLPDCMFKDIEIGDYIEIMESRPISKIINFVVVKKISSNPESTNNNIMEEKLK
jgi:small subunit ribosomal protein S17